MVHVQFLRRVVPTGISVGGSSSFSFLAIFNANGKVILIATSIPLNRDVQIIQIRFANNL